MDKEELKSLIEDMVADSEIEISDRKTNRIFNKVLENRYEHDITSDELFEQLQSLFPKQKDSDEIVEFLEEVVNIAMEFIQDSQEESEDEEEERD